jgi:hypothetical protein
MSRKVLGGLALGGLMAAMTFAIPMLSSLSASLVIARVQRCMLVLVFPGIIGAGAISGNVNAWPLWIAAGLNMSIYFAIGWLSCWIGMRLFGRRP